LLHNLIYSPLDGKTLIRPLGPFFKIISFLILASKRLP